MLAVTGEALRNQSVAELLAFVGHGGTPQYISITKAINSTLKVLWISLQTTVHIYLETGTLPHFEKVQTETPCSVHKYQHQTPPRPRVRKVIEQGISNEDKNAVAFIFSIIYSLRGTMSGHQFEIKRA